MFRAAKPIPNIEHDTEHREKEGIMANRSDLKLAIFSILLTMGNEDDLARVFTMALHLNQQRNRQHTAELLASFDRDDS